MFFLNNNYLYSYYNIENMENIEKIEIFIQDLINNFNKFIGFKGFKEGLDEKKYDFITVREPIYSTPTETKKDEKIFNSGMLPIENRENYNKLNKDDNLYIYNKNSNNYELFKIQGKMELQENTGYFFLILDKLLNNMVQAGSKVYIHERPPDGYEYLNLVNELKDARDKGLVYASEAKDSATNAETYASTSKTHITKAEEASSKANQYASTAGTYITQAKEASTKAEEYAKSVLESTTNVGNYSKQAKEFAKTAEANATNAGTYATNAQDSSTNAETNARNAETNARKIETSYAKASAAATKAEASSTEADLSSKQALDYATKADQANKNTQKDILSAQSLTSPAQNLDSIEGFIDSSSRATEILNNPTKFSEFTELVRTHILARADNTKQARLLQASELLTQKDTIASNIIMDYLYKNEKGTNVNKVYDRITEQNDDKMRKIDINTYYNKAYQEYFNILKVIILVCIIIVPIIIANKNNLVPDIVTMFLIVAIIVVTMIFIFYKFSDIYMRDTADFDKMKIPYDREGETLQKEGTIKKKKNLLTSLTLTCIGEDCCDGSMVYDFAKNRCIATENFGNFFDKKINERTTTTTLVEPMSNIVFNKQYLVSNSLNCSDKDNFYSNECKNDIRFN